MPIRPLIINPAIHNKKKKKCPGGLQDCGNDYRYKLLVDPDISGPGCDAPAITVQPSAQVVNTGTEVTFTVTATGTAPLTYTWRKDGVSVQEGSSNSYVIASAVLGDAGTYDVIIENDCGTASSNAALLTVNLSSLADATIILNANSPGFAYADNDRMTTGWNDISGNARHFTQDYGVGTYGLYKVSGGKAYVDFDSSNTKIGRASVPFTDFMGTNVGTIAMIINQYHASNSNAVMTHRPGDTSNKWLFHLAFADNNFYHDWGNQFGGGRVSHAMPSGWRDGTFKVLIIRRNGNRLDVYQNGVSVYSNASAYSSARTNTTDTVDLGGVSGSGWRLAWWSTWKRSLSDTEVTDLDAYLQTLKP